MIKPLLTRVGVAVGSLALSLTAGVGVASADPDLGSAVDSTCTYSQFVAALNAQDPQYGLGIQLIAGPAGTVAAVPRRAAGVGSTPAVGPGGGEQSQSSESTGITDYSKGF